MPESIEPSSAGEKVLFTKQAIAGATLLGGPLGAIYLIAVNFRALGNDLYAKRTLVIGTVVTLLAVPLFGSVPDRAFNHFTTQLLRLLWLVPVNLVVQKFQQHDIKAHLASGGAKGSPWKVVGVGMVSMAVALGYAFLYQHVTSPPEIDDIPILESTVKMDFSRCTIYYDSTATSQADAKVVGAILEKVGYFQPADSGVEAASYKDRGAYIIGLPVREEAMHDEEVDRLLQQALKDLKQAYHDRFYKFRLLTGDTVEATAEKYIEAK